MLDKNLKEKMLQILLLSSDTTVIYGDMTSLNGKGTGSCQSKLNMDWQQVAFKDIVKNIWF